jgi:flagellar motor switch/type III secretory pathway protein FliN
LPEQGVLLIHEGVLAPPRHESFRLGWFLGSELKAALQATAGGEEALPDRLSALAAELADQLATDKYTLGDPAGKASEELWPDYLGGELPTEVGWLRFTVTGLEAGEQDLWLAWPIVVLERMFGPATPAAAPPSPGASSQASVAAEPDPEPAVIPVSSAPPKNLANIQRLLRTPVPIIVTLATKDIPTSKLLDMAPGTLIEFDKPCDEPLQISVNNLPIGYGEAVKIGDHFGLKLTAIVPLEERAAKLGGKWRF